MIRCMGLERNREQCECCDRLPRSIADEQSEGWFEHEQMHTPCQHYKQHGFRARVLRVEGKAE